MGMIPVFLLLLPCISGALYFPLVHKYVKHQHNPYGHQYSCYNIHGYLVPIETLLTDNTAKHHFEATILAYQANWIALLPDDNPAGQRYKQLLQLAISNGASAIIVAKSKFQGRKEQKTFSNSHRLSQIQVPSGFILKSDYTEILRLSNGQRESAFLYVVLQPGDDPRATPHWFAMSMLLLISMFFLFAMYNFIKTILSQPETIYTVHPQLRPLKRTELDALTTIASESKCNLMTNEKCSICLEEFDPDKRAESLTSLKLELRLLPCGHCFHTACIDPWLLARSVLCPLCKKNVQLMMEPREESTTNTIESQLTHR